MKKSYFGSLRSKVIIRRILQSSRSRALNEKFAIDNSSNDFGIGFLFSCCRVLKLSDW
jgi:hypothetical protein